MAWALIYPAVGGGVYSPAKFVATTGNDTTGDGTIGNPYLTPAKGVSMLSAGDTLYLRGGTYIITNQIELGGKNNGTALAPYRISSYPGEWAVLDGQHSITTWNSSFKNIFQASSHAVSYWYFEHMELTGGGVLPVSGYVGEAIHGSYRNCKLRYLYIHDNYGDQPGPGAVGGVAFKHGSFDNDGLGSQGNLVEYCWFKCNGDPTLTGGRMAEANLVFEADYAYANPGDINTANVRNEVRYNLFDSTGAAGYTPVGICYKGMQRLTGYTYGEADNPADAVPRSTAYREYGDKIHHNIFRGHELAVRCDSDYHQIYNNIVDWDGVSGASAGVATADPGSIERRGSYWPCVYNNTIISGGAGTAIQFVIAWNDWDGVVDGTNCAFAHAFAPNNVITGAGYDAYNTAPITVWNGAPTNVSGLQPYTWDDFQFSRNFFYDNGDNSLVFIIQHGWYQTIAQAVTGGGADVAWSKTTPSPFVGGSGTDKYRLTGSYALDGTYTVATGGLGGGHPYLAGVTIPGYVGAANPADSSWIDTVAGLSNTDNLKG